MILTLVVSLAAMTLLYVTLLTYRTKLERLRDGNRELAEVDIGRAPAGAATTPMPRATGNTNA
jgi:hypothetical protein